MTNFIVYLTTGEVKHFNNFVDEEGMGCFYNEDDTRFSFDADKTVFIETADGESTLYKYDKVVVS